MRPKEGRTFVQAQPVEESRTPITTLKVPPSHPGHMYTDILVEPCRWITEACEEAEASVEAGGGPFGVVLIQVDDETNQVLRYWRDRNHVTDYVDPTAHAEVSVIRSACHELNVYDLGTIMRTESRLPQVGDTSHCEIYSSCEPCPMCYAAIRWARIPVLVFSATRYEASRPDVGFSDKEVYEDLGKSYSDRGIKVHQAVCSNSLDAFKAWKRSGNPRY